MERDAAIVEVGLNEAALRSQNPHVPYSPTECAADAARCATAGAAVVHWHGRDPVTGEQRLADVALHAQALESMRPSGVLAYPSYPIDVGSVSVVIWDERAREFPLVGAGPGVVANPLAFTLAALERIDTLGMVPTLGAFDIGFTRTVAHLVDAGKVRPPVLLKIFLAGAWAAGPFPSEEALDFHLRQLPADLDVEWLVVPYAVGDPAVIERLCRHALERGGGVRVGIGDNPTAQPELPNVALVGLAARWAEDAGRPLATPDDVRRRFGLERRIEPSMGG